MAWAQRLRSGCGLVRSELGKAGRDALKVKLMGTSNFVKVVVVRDGKYVYSTEPNRPNVDFTWRDNEPSPGKTSYYHVRGEQDNAEIVRVSPFWITYRAN
jgi:hypothetical protein